MKKILDEIEYHKKSLSDKEQELKTFVINNPVSFLNYPELNVNLLDEFLYIIRKNNKQQCWYCLAILTVPELMVKYGVRNCCITTIIKNYSNYYENIESYINKQNYNNIFKCFENTEVPEWLVSEKKFRKNSQCVHYKCKTLFKYSKKYFHMQIDDKCNFSYYLKNNKLDKEIISYIGHYSCDCLNELFATESLDILKEIASKPICPDNWFLYAVKNPNLKWADVCCLYKKQKNNKVLFEITKLLLNNKIPYSVIKKIYFNLLVN